MRRHTGNSWVQGHSCSALAKLGQSADGLAAIIDAGAMPLVVKAIQDNFNNSWVRSNACEVLSTMSSLGSKDVRQAVTSALHEVSQVELCPSISNEQQCNRGT